jgi:hypothetical protein
MGSQSSRLAADGGSSSSNSTPPIAIKMVSLHLDFLTVLVNRLTKGTDIEHCHDFL